MSRLQRMHYLSITNCNSITKRIYLADKHTTIFTSADQQTKIIYDFYLHNLALMQLNLSKGLAESHHVSKRPLICTYLTQ